MKKSTESFETYITRLTWNEANWRKPSSASVKRKGEKTYVATYGFGHEEWLNRSEWLLHGWRYAFLQGVHRSRKRLVGKRIRVLLYTIHPVTMRRLYVGKIESLEVIEDEIAKLAVQALRERGWLALMKLEIKSAGGNSTGLKPAFAHTIVNVRFAPEDLVMYHKPIPARPHKRILRYTRYGLIRADDRVISQWKERTGRAPQQQPRSLDDRVFRLPARLVKANPVETKMEIEIEAVLKKQFGAGSVKAQHDWIDLKVVTPSRLVLIEIKSSSDARTAIRHALGQLLEYAYFENLQLREPELVIVARGVKSKRVDHYLGFLQRKFHLFVKYKRYELGTHRFNL